MRWPLAVWNWLMTEPGTYVPKRDYDAEWNRGAYLVQAAGHCGACHTPRGIGEQEKALDERDSDFLAGGVLDNWSASNLRGDANTGLGRWSEDDLIAFLKTGRSRFGSAFGTMREVVSYSTKFLDDADLKAIAKYLKSMPADVDGKQPVWVYNNTTFEDLKAGRVAQPGAAAFLRNCASCHGLDGRGGGDMPALAGNPAVLDSDPVSLIRVVMNGTPTSSEPDAPKGPSMPQFRTWLKDQEIADVVGFIRSAWGNRTGAAPPVKSVADIRAQTAIDEDRSVILRMR
jgi:mono/diheme cytochrome c family protein